ncbi:uncharacterized protein K444DRAFT_589725 [Hyaloscypha bicolor E]|uniref:DUF6594 domain-containing protein n=1 Tax=Hyaloscypha bicolor E TaxID=1095630 RepID=A0A2J6TAK1_9HELO|nr:uncharacterized protein K444DRAFT_589725 [Hyaloscypha bicolor E]PMD60011.1 hypothetical protein K444DRAFT_589725 [Hyaloscypha bicolor E]
MPARPEIAARGSSYATDFDEAERASSGFRHPKVEATLRTSRSATIYERLSRTSTAVSPGTIFSLPRLKNIVTSASSTVSNLWQYKLFQRETSLPVLRPFKWNNVDDYPEGYPQLAALITSDDNFCIYRKFDRASNRVLLHLQSEIAALDNGLNQMDRADDGSTTAYRLRSTRHEEGWDGEQRKTITKLQDKLPIYYDLLLKSSQLKALGPPLKHNHQSLFHWIEGKKPVMEQEDDWILHEDDLVGLSEIDHLESSLASSFLNRLFRPSRCGDGCGGPVVTYFSQKRISAAAKSISVFIAVAILILPVSILVWTPWNRAWISVTVLLSVLIFSTLLSLSTKIKAKDILLGSAAYCAVLATFLGNLPSNGPPRSSPSAG